MSPSSAELLNSQRNSNTSRLECVPKPIYYPRHMRIICIGAGFAGLCFAYKLQRSFDNYDMVIYEKNQAIAGVWFENRYPG